jgi:hypothetical protein
MTAILVQFPDESVKLDEVEERRVLTALEVMYEGGSLHGKTADFPSRDLERVVLRVHGRNRHSFETYERTICVDIRSRRTIFRYAGLTSKSTTAVGGRGCSATTALQRERAKTQMNIACSSRRFASAN